MSVNPLKLILISITCCFIHALPCGATEPQHPYAAGELLVKFKADSRGVSTAALRQAAGVRQAHRVGRSDVQRVILAAGASVDHALTVYANDPNVEFAEPNYLLHTQGTPDDPHFGRQWGLHNSGQMVSGYIGTAGADMDMNNAWEITLGDPQAVVAVVDTGCDLNHPDLAANIWVNPGEIPGNGLDDDGNGYIDDVNGWDFVDGDNSPQDATGHGTHVAGIIAAAGDNGQGIAGVAWQARIMTLRFMDAFETGTTADAIQAIQYALDQGVRIINCSWGTVSHSAALKSVIDSSNALFICAAGNGGIDTDATAFYPASFSSANIIAVAAGDQMDHLAWFSNFGTASVDVVAPGIRIYSLDNGRGTLWSENFDDGALSGWSTGGEVDRWAVATVPYSQAGESLAISPDENYGDNTDSWASLPTLDLTAASASELTFHLIGSTQANADYLYLEISVDGSNWYTQPLMVNGAMVHAGISGPLPYWASAKLDLGPWDGMSNVYVRFRFRSDGQGTDSGFYIDNIVLNAAMAQDQYRFMQGTSMAAGFVSGLAALVQSANPSLTALAIKDIIMNSVDLDLGLCDATLSGGRVSAYNALTLLRELTLSATYSKTDSIQLLWSASTALDSALTVQRRADGEMEFTDIGQVEAAASTYEDQTVSSDMTYYYRVEAVTGDGRNGYSNQSLANTTIPTPEATGSGSSGGSGGCFISDLAVP